MGERFVQCLVTNPATNKSLGICNQKILTGHLPLPVQDFSCLSDNWHSLNCTWHAPANPVETNYTVFFVEPGKLSQPRSCPSPKDLVDYLGHPGPANSCYIDLTTHPPYRQTIQIYTFFFNATNRLLPAGRIQKFEVDHYAVVRPGQPVNVEVEAVSACELLLTYTVPRELRHFG